MHKSDFSLFFSDPFMLSVDASGVVPVGVRPPPPPARRDSFSIRMANKTAIIAAVWRTEGALRHAQNLLNPHRISTAPISIIKKQH